MIVLKKFRSGKVIRAEIHDDHEKLFTSDNVIVTVPIPGHSEIGKSSLRKFNDKYVEELSKDIGAPKKELEQRSFIYEGTQSNLHITISAGIATFPEDAQTDYDLINQADLALYEDKKRK